jgi:hypothetical protein
VASTRLVDGRVLQAVVTDTDAFAIVVVDPADCLSCDRPLYSLLQARRRHPGAVAFVLSRPPTDYERRQLALQHEVPDAVIAGRSLVIHSDSPAVLPFVRGHFAKPVTVSEARPFLRQLFHLPPVGDSSNPIPGGRNDT